MPAEIDLGGPRVLHCVERADCPIKKSPSNIYSVTINPDQRVVSPNRRTHRQPRDRRCFRCCCCCCCPTTLPPTRHGSSSVIEPLIVRGTDEPNEFYHSDGSSIEVASSNGLRHLRNGFRGRQNVRKRSDKSLNGNLDDGRVQGWEIRTGIDVTSSRDCFREVEDTDRVVGRGEEVVVVRVDDTRQHRPYQSARTTKTTTTRRRTIACDRNPAIREDHRDSIEDRSSIIDVRLFDGCDGCGCVETKRRSYGPSSNPDEHRRAVKSSQRERCCTNNDDQPIVNIRDVEQSHDDDDEERGNYRVERAWRWNSDNVDTDESMTNDRARLKTKRRKFVERSLNNGRSYFQLWLLIFLIAFGNTSWLKWNHGGTVGSYCGIGAAVGALTIGTVVGSVRGLPVDVDAGIRAERSANLSHITGVSRKIQMYIKNRHLQILPDGSVNGSNDDTSEYTIFQRTSVSRGQLKIQGVATCLYLCMDACGLLYGSREYTDDCVFNETLEQHNYNTYSSVRWSTAKKTLYLGLNRWGQPRRVQAKGHNLGRLSAYARVLTRVATPDRVDAIQARILGAHHNLRHHHNSHHHRNIQQLVCPDQPTQDKDNRDKFRCRKRKKRKKRKRRCKKGEKPGSHCDLDEEHRGGNAETTGEDPPQSKRSCEGAASEELCRKQALDAPAKKRKSRIDPTLKTSNANKDKQSRNRGKEFKSKKKLNSDDSTNLESTKRANDTIGIKRKRPLSRQKSGSAIRKKLNGRSTRISLPAPSSTVSAVTLPSSWYPSASVTPTMEVTGPTEVSTWLGTKFESSPKNAVTVGGTKINKSGMRINDKFETTKIGKAREVVEETLADGWTTVSSGEVDVDRYSTLMTESSAEISEETRSDEFGLEDDGNGFSGEYSTVMTTMDTTSPERTKDYTSVTTPTILTSVDLETSSIDEPRGSEPSKPNQLSSEAQ